MRYLVTLLVSMLVLAAGASADVIKIVQSGASDQSVTLKIIDEETGAPVTDVTHESSGLDLKYWRHGANAAVDITEASQTVNGAHTDGGLVHLFAGHYRLDLPDAAVAAGATAVDVGGVVTGGIVIGGTVQLSTDVPQTGDAYARIGATGSGLTSLASAADQADIKAVTDNLPDSGALTSLASASDQAAIKAVTDKLDDTLEDQGGGTYGFTEAALQEAPTGGSVDDAKFGIVASGTAQGGTSTTIQLASATDYPDGYLDCMTVLITDGTGAGQSRSIASEGWDGDTDTATVTIEWVTTPDTDSDYIVYGVSCGTGSGATPAEVWAYEDRTLTEFDEDNMTIDLNSTAIGSVAGNVGGNVVGTVNGLTSTAQGHVQTATAAALTAYDPPTNAEMEARTLAAANYATATALATLDNVADGIKAVTDNLPDSGALTSLATAADQRAIKSVTDKLEDTLELDGEVYRFTANALEQAPAGEGGGGGDWNADEKTAIKTILGVPDSGTTPDDPSDGILDDIRDLVSGLNDLSSADVESAAEAGAAAALADYDPPTHTELTSALSNLNDLSAAEAEAAALAALGDYDPPTHAELTSAVAGTLTSQRILLGTCDSGSTTTCVDDALTQADASQLEERLICFDDSWCALITEFNPSNDTVTTTKTAPSTRSGKAYTIFPATLE